MRRRRTFLLRVLAACSVAGSAAGLCPLAVAAQTRVPGAEDWGRFETPGTGVLSPDGRWLAYTVSRSDGHAELRVADVRTGGDVTGATVAFGTAPAFSRNGRWLAYRIGRSEAERERMERQRQPIRDRVGIRDMAQGTEVVIDDVAAFSFSADGRFIALRRYAPAGERRSTGVDLVVRRLEDGMHASFGSVAQFAWRHDGATLAMAIDAEASSGNGVTLYDAGSGTLRPLDAADARYTALAWRRESDDIAVLRSLPVDTARFRDTAYVAIAWRGTSRPAPARRALEAALPDSLRIVAMRGISWADDGRYLLLGVRPRDVRPAQDSARRGGPTPPDTADVTVWHYRDTRIVPQRRVTERQDRNASLPLAWFIDDGHTTILTDDPAVSLLTARGALHGVAIDGRGYEFDAAFGRPSWDLRRVDLRTGEHAPIATRVALSLGVSPGGRYLLYATDHTLRAYDLRTGTNADIGARVAAQFFNQESDHPVPHRGVYGIAGWTPDDRSVLVYDRFDVWELRPDGSGGRRLTRGAEEEIVHRVVRLDPEQRHIDLRQPVHLSLYGEWTKQSGYARLRGDRVDRLVLQDASVGRLTKAQDADVYAWVVQRFDRSPDWFAGDAALAAPRQLTRTNPFLGEFAWGRSELITYTTPHGQRLQGALYYPNDYVPGRTYPMIVYIYEKLSQGLHGFVAPSERSPYNTSVFTANGYLVLRPDIHFRPREPGFSILESVEAAVQTVIDMGLTAPRRVGVTGHSWGGYGTTFLATQSDLLGAAVAGAAPTNLVSMYGSIFWSAGAAPEMGHFEVGQERMEVPLWEDPDAYIRNSSVLQADKLRMPLLVAFGERDTNVDYRQGIELYNAARRLGKELVMIVYADEDHGLVKRKNQVDYLRKQLDWFNHHLKGEPAAAWMMESR